MKNPILLSIVLCVFGLVSGCTEPDKAPVPSSTTLVQPLAFTSTPMLRITSTQPQSFATTSLSTQTRTSTLPPKLTSTNTAPPTWTPLPTLSPTDAQARVFELLESNAGCELPCWWGITPGLTTWQETRQFLESFTLLTGIVGPETNRIASFRIPSPDEGSINHWYSIRAGLVEEIGVYNYDLAPAYYFRQFLERYGQPDEVGIRTFRNESRNSQPFLFDLFYRDKRILIEYSGGEIEIKNGMLQNCVSDMRFPFIYLWAPDREYSFDEATDRFLDTENMPDPIALEEATGIGVYTFFEMVVNTDTEICIETPAELWPEQ